MLNKCLDIREDTHTHSGWGTRNCPVCKGVGVINNRDLLTGLYRLQEYICPLCDSYRKPCICPAWFKDQTVYPNQWIFLEDYACDEIIRILRILDSFVFKTGFK